VDITTLLDITLDWQDSIGCHAHISSESGVWFPAGRVSWTSSLLHHSVDLLESKSLGLPDEEVGVEQAEDAGGTPEEEDFGFEVGLVGVDEVGGDDLYTASK